MLTLSQGQTVIVIDCSNYRGSHQEAVPFKASVVKVYDDEVVVESIDTGKPYTLYIDQILETYSDEHLKQLINTDKYGDIC